MKSACISFWYGWHNIILCGPHQPCFPIIWQYLIPWIGKPCCFDNIDFVKVNIVISFHGLHNWKGHPRCNHFNIKSTACDTFTVWELYNGVSWKRIKWFGELYFSYISSEIIIEIQKTRCMMNKFKEESAKENLAISEKVQK